ncbi:hypothetical protein JD844_005661 [Phrynosoma platyrhinos]|uniref:Vomeronasal type-2 receptor 26-like n=1 Tax=Phrynosoma platyrhinos TaxID=52577 RepID=A0ABQ7TNV0_PHRPL|nr:hypothetical protein JD844_005661 [Phrynosoma platyrhinos]
MSKSYQQVLAFVFAVEKINKDPHFLPNVSLGFRLYDNYYNGGQTYENVISLLSERDKLSPVYLPFYAYGPYYAYGRPSYHMKNTEKVKIFPNYNCQGKKKMVAVIEGLTSELSMQVANLLGIFKINYGSSDPVLGNEIEFPGLYQIHPSDDLQHVGIAQLLLHLGWLWIGLVAPKYGASENVLLNLQDVMQKNGICVEFMLLFEAHVNFFHELQQRREELWNSSSKVVLAYGDAKFLSLIFPHISWILAGKVWLTTAKWDANLYISTRSFSGALSFGPQEKEIPGFRFFLQSVTVPKYPNDVFIKNFWSREFNCNLPPPYSRPPLFRVRSCTGQEKLDGPDVSHFEVNMSPLSNSICKTVFGVAKALHKLTLDRLDQRQKKNRPGVGNIFLWQSLKYTFFVQFHRYLKKILFNNSALEGALFDGIGDTTTYEILNWILLPNHSLVSIRIGEVNLHYAANHTVTIQEEMTLWNVKFAQPPHSRCSHNCLPGLQKVPFKTRPKCCFHCIECPKGEISNQTDTLKEKERVDADTLEQQLGLTEEEVFGGEAAHRADQPRQGAAQNEGKMTKTLCDLDRSYAEGYYKDGDLILGGVLSLSQQNIPSRNYKVRPEEVSPYGAQTL